MASSSVQPVPGTTKVAINMQREGKEMNLQEHLVHNFSDNYLGQGSVALGQNAPLPRSSSLASW